jgi:hypothetical protein
MPKFVIERTIPGAGSFDDQTVKNIAQSSNEVLDSMAGRAQWLHSYVTDDKLYCLYIADDDAAVKEHATAGGFPCDSTAVVRRVIDPTTGEG